jgi:hypothetical protein
MICIETSNILFNIHPAALLLARLAAHLRDEHLAANESY